MKRLLLFATLALCSPAFADDAMFRGNPQHTGVYDAAGVPQFTKIKWQFHTQGQILSSPQLLAARSTLAAAITFFMLSMLLQPP